MGKVVNEKENTEFWQTKKGQKIFRPYKLSSIINY